MPESFSHILLFVTPWTVAHQIPLSMRFPRQEYWSRLPFLSPGELSDQRIEPAAPAASPGLQEDSLLLSRWGSHTHHYRYRIFYCQDIKDKQTIIFEMYFEKAFLQSIQIMFLHPPHHLPSLLICHNTIILSQYFKKSV